MFKKYDVVGFKLNGELRYGVVEKGGSKSVTVVDIETQDAYKGSVKAFILSDKPLPVDTIKTPMDGVWGVTGVKELLNGHGDSRTFEAFITYKGKKVIVVCNDGHGGCNEYNMLTLSNPEILNVFGTDVKAWIDCFPNADDLWRIELWDTWVEWAGFCKPYGKTAEAFLNNPLVTEDASPFQS